MGALCRARHGTILPATPTFLRAYLRCGRPEDFAGLDAVLTGGEPLPGELAGEVEAAFGVRPVQGYGATEASSLISANIPASRANGGAAVCREGSVGRLLPGVRAKIVDVDSGEEIGPGRQGLLWISGPNVMAGYFDQPDATNAVLRDGWYATSDIAVIHDDGCLAIVGRRSRFAKIGGEMVPLGNVEAALLDRLADGDGDGDGDDGPLLAVAAVPDAVRGERLIVLHRPLDRAPSDLCRDLIASGLPPVFVPAAADFVPVDRLPLTATGKLDLGELNAMALQAVAARQMAVV